MSQDVQLQLSWILEEIDNESYSKRSLMRPLIDDLYIYIYVHAGSSEAGEGDV